jgi:FHA domain-containing protein
VDLATLAVSLTRDQFSARFQCAFLCADLTVGRTTRPQRTEVFPTDEPTDARLEPLPGPPFVAPLVKVQEQYPSMIMLGRTLNNDIVVGDTSISKFHAFFRVAPGLIEVADAGSRNGTYVAGVRLEPKQMARLKPGDRVRFARLPFQLLDASSCWDFIIRANDQWG